MDIDTVWSHIDRQRRELAAVLSRFAAEDWDVPSLCTGWTVRDVAGHAALSPQYRWRDVPRLMALGRMSMDRAIMLDAEAYGWVQRSAFDGTDGWSLTDAGRRRNEEMLAAELDGNRGARATVVAVHDMFVPVNGAVTKLITEWQLADDHADGGQTLAALEKATDVLGWMEHRLTDHLARFSGYVLRFDRARERAHQDPQWVAGVGIDSCHQVWFELHEDLIATLGLRR